MSTSENDVPLDNSIEENAPKRARQTAEGEDTSSYIGPKRSKVRGNIRGAGNYKGKRSDGWGPGTRNAETASRAAMAEEDPENATTTTTADDDDGEDKEARLPKRKVALLMGYCGTGYQGMQVYVCGKIGCPLADKPTLSLLETQWMHRTTWY
jgi:hypothetical protein